MATLTITLTVGAQTVTKTITFADARAVVFLDDLIANYPEVDDGSGGTRPMTREEVGDFYVDRLLMGQVEWAKGLAQRRLDAIKPVATDLEGN